MQYHKPPVPIATVSGCGFVFPLLGSPEVPFTSSSCHKLNMAAIIIEDCVFGVPQYFLWLYRTQPTRMARPIHQYFRLQGERKPKIGNSCTGLTTKTMKPNAVNASILSSCGTVRNQNPRRVESSVRKMLSDSIAIAVCMFDPIATPVTESRRE